ncbi:hypothetical protein H6F44_20265 [Pseudanabaena sp. FACHB-1277]|uniref:Type III restriction enzyme C-terminal endonuclease domain-containing protein n=1 Tax=Pseudanabaena cinerea FACHB-1277 TaxID=2949581 RepID=A0A926Z877_9CYAN|nr:hypothetical protein [Pseudanabaena cinerea]MBD2152433.1 hypothetical protein [Pseudanabaena cinerea FACHB-1277]
MNLQFSAEMETGTGKTYTFLRTIHELTATLPAIKSVKGKIKKTSTKGTLDHHELRELEKTKISCGEKHFALFEPLGVKYQLVEKTSHLY